MSDEAKEPKEEKPSQETSEKIENKEAEAKKEESKPEVKNKVQKITRTLPCKFTEQEHRDATDELLDLIEDKDKLEQDKSDIVKSYGNQIKGLEEKIIEKTALIRSGVKDKPVECEWRFNNPRHGKKSLWRLDENRIIDTQDMDLLDSGTVEEEKEEKKKPGDNGAKFVLANRTVDIVDYEDVSAELTTEVLKDTVIAKSMNGDKMVAFTEADLLAKSFKAPDGNFRIIRGKSKDGKTTNYFIQKLPATESPEPEKAPANAHEEKKGKGRGKKKEEAAPAPAPEKQQESPEEKKPEEKKPDTQAQAQNISLFLAKHNLSVAEVETLLRQEKRLGISTSLQTTATAVEYVMNNIEDIKEALKKTA